MPAIAERAPLMIIGISRVPARRRWTALASWMAPEAKAHVPKTTSTALMSEPKAAPASAATASVLTAALTCSRRERLPPRAASVSDATTSMAG
jgi:hypothetical protein